MINVVTFFRFMTQYYNLPFFVKSKGNRLDMYYNDGQITWLINWYRPLDLAYTSVPEAIKFTLKRYNNIYAK